MKKSTIPILGLLTVEPMSGYEMKKAIEKSLGYFWRESFGQIYPQLRALSSEGLITEHPRDKPVSGRLKHVYEITDAGREALRQWLEQKPSEQVMRNELLLKIFFATECDPQVILAHCERARQHALNAIELMKGIEEMLDNLEHDSRKIVYWRITARYGLHSHRAILDWCDETLETLARLARLVDTRNNIKLRY